MDESPILSAIELLRSGRIDESKEILSISDSDLSDQKFVAQLSSLSTGLELVTSDQVLDSIEHFQNSLDLVEKCSDQEVKILIPLLIQYGTGLNQLHSGDAFGAYQTLQNVAASARQLAFFDNQLQKFALSAQASSCIAIARTNITAGNVEEAQKWFANAENVYESLLKILDENNPDDIGAFIEAYGLPVELSAYWAFYDLQVLEIQEAKNRLKLAEDKLEALQNFSDKLTESPTKKVSKVILKNFSATNRLNDLAEKLLLNKKNLDSDDLNEIKEIINSLSESRELSLQAGRRGHGNLWFIKQLKKFAKNLISIKSVGKKEVNRYSSLISFAAFIVILIVVNFVFQPNEALGLGYFFGALLLSLVIGYGFGALKFLPLLKTYRDVLKDIKQE